jgi:flavin-dependent trigonelline monooxygenase, oxygenase component
MRFGIFLSYNRIYPPEHYDTNIYDERLEQAVLADELGYDIIWIPEHHMVHFFQVPSVTTLLTQIGLSVQCKVGAMVVLPLYRHPIITAGEVALVDNLLHGRLEIGLGRGAYAYEFERLDIPFDDARERLPEAIEVLEKIWHGPGGVSHEGKYYSFDTSHVWPRPYQTPHPPLWLGAQSTPTIEWGVKQGYHISNWPFVLPMSQVESVATTFHNALAAAGKQRGDQRLAILRGTWTAATEKDARKHVETVRTNNRIAILLHNFEQNADTRGYVPPDPIENEPTPDQAFENLIFGSPEQCFDKVRRYDELGVDDLLLMFDFGAPHEEVLESMRVFAEGVMEPYRARYGHDQGLAVTTAAA